MPVRRGAGHALSLLGMTLVALTGTACYHATGLQLPTVSAEEIPIQGGARVPGLKKAAGPGDYYVGNDHVSLGVDGTRFGQPQGSAVDGALSGGSIVDFGYAQLDQNFKRVQIPGDSLERLTPVVNLDPTLPVVISQFETLNEGSRSTLLMTGQIHDPAGKISGGTRDADGRIQGVTVIHRIILERQVRHAVLETVVTNTTGAAIGIRSLGDYLHQQGGGYRLNIPATATLKGASVSNWGLDIPKAGAAGASDFAHPLDTAVQAGFVAMAATEPGDVAADTHTAVALVADDFSPLAVVADPQFGKTAKRPTFPERMVAGSLPIDALGAGKSLTYRRRLYINGGSTGSGGALTSQATPVVNDLYADRFKELVQDFGVLSFSTFGTASRAGNVPAEVRVERNTGTAQAPVWTLERVEWWEPSDLPSSTGSITMNVPVGTYRLVVSNGAGKSLVLDQAIDGNAANNRGPRPVPIQVTKDNVISVVNGQFTNKTVSLDGSNYICPERADLINANGTLLAQPLFAVTLSARPGGGTQDVLQPIRFTVQGTAGTPDPDFQRGRALAGHFDVVTKKKQANPTYVGAFQYWGGTTAFGANTTPSASISLPVGPGQYNIFTTRGPLAALDLAQVKAGEVDGNPIRNLIAFNPTMPDGWLSFDLPGTTQATDGTLHPSEILSSALAEHVQVIGFRDKETYPDARGLRAAFRDEIDISTYPVENKVVVGDEPVVIGGRTSDLGAFGVATALFTPDADYSRRRNGARMNVNWRLADFLAQAGGSYTVIHKPRDPQTGLFARKGFDPTVPLGQGVNAWWNETGALSNGRQHGQFDALELLRAEGCDPANPTPWFTEFLQVRRDWFSLLSQQTPTAFTKALGLSGARFSRDTPIGLARTYVKATGVTEDSQVNLLNAFQTGALVASTGPLLDVTVNGGIPGSLVTGTSLTFNVTLYAPDWMPMDELRVVANGQVVKTLTMADLTLDPTTSRKYTGTFTVTLSNAKDAWVVVEAGVPLSTTGVYRAGTPWNAIMKGIYPVAVTNPFFIDTNGNGYTAPGL